MAPSLPTGPEKGDNAMDDRAIGVFDSGMGGLTAVRELIRRLPGEDVVYFGDTGRVPYGGRGRDTIIKYARQDVAFLRTFDLKAIVIACGTVSTTALDILARENPLPVIGVVEPAAQAAVAATKTGRIGLVGTRATIASGAYERTLRRLMPEAQVTARACPLFVPFVENGRFQPGDPLVDILVAEYLAPFREAEVDTLVLGCTHYPLLWDAIAQYLGPQVTLISSGAACVDTVARLLEKGDLLSAKTQGGVHRYFASDSAQDFGALASVFLGEDIQGQAQQIAIENY